MKALFLSTCVFLLGCQSAETPNPKPENKKTEKAGKQPSVSPKSDAFGSEMVLFDGESKFGLAEPGGKSRWRVENGELIAPKEGVAEILCPIPLMDFELTGEFRCDDSSDAAVRVRAKGEAGYEMTIRHPKRSPGEIVGHSASKIASDADWTSVRIRAIGDQLTTFVDDKPAADITDRSGKARRIGLVGLISRKGGLRCRKLTIRPLRGGPIAGWDTVPGSEAETSLKDGVIAIKGKGYLQSKGTWGNFILQTEVRMTPGSNSGIFFRSMVGTKEAPANGYECQLYNKVEGNDPTKPADNQKGTGAIFRRGPAARKVHSKDNEWFSVTIIAFNRSIATWVNGQPVVSWRDPAGADENPRRGYRQAAGRIILQGHDDMTDVKFRNLRITPLDVPK